MIKHTLLPVALATGISSVVLVPGQDVAPVPPASPSPPTVAPATTAVAVPMADGIPLVLAPSPARGLAPSVATAPMVDGSPPVVVAGLVPVVSVAPVPAAVATVAIPMTPGGVVRVGPSRKQLAQRIEEVIVALRETESSYERNALTEELLALEKAVQEAASRASASRPDGSPRRGTRGGRADKVRAQSGRDRIGKIKAAIEALEAAGEHKAAMALAEKLEQSLAKRKAELAQRARGETKEREPVDDSIRQQLAQARQKAAHHEKNGEHKEAAAIRQRIEREVSRWRQREPDLRSDAKEAAVAEHARQAAIREKIREGRREGKALHDAGEHKKAEAVRRRLMEAEKQIAQQKEFHNQRPPAGRAHGEPRAPRADSERPARDPRGPQPPRAHRETPPTRGGSRPPRAHGRRSPAPDPAPRHDRGEVRRAGSDDKQMAHAHAKIEHLQRAAENLAAAGMDEQAHKVHAQAKSMAMKIRAQAHEKQRLAESERRHGPDRDDMEALRREVSELHKIVAELRRQVMDYHRERE